MNVNKLKHYICIEKSGNETLGKHMFTAISDQDAEDWVEENFDDENEINLYKLSHVCRWG